MAKKVQRHNTTKTHTHTHVHTRRHSDLLMGFFFCLKQTTKTTTNRRNYDSKMRLIIEKLTHTYTNTLAP